MKKFTKYFGGEYQKYWYVASVITIILMALSMYNSRAVTTYELTIYNADGTVKSQEIVDQMFVARENERVGVSKKYVPIKPF